MLNVKNIKTIRPNKLLDYKNIGPFKIIRAINNSAYKLELSLAIRRVYSIFYP